METQELNPIVTIDVISQPKDGVSRQAEVLAVPFGATGIMEEVDAGQFQPNRFATCTLTGVPADDIGSETK